MTTSSDLKEGQQVKLNAAILDEPIFGKVVFQDNQVTVKFINWRNEISTIEQKPTNNSNELDWYNIEIIG